MLLSTGTEMLLSMYQFDLIQRYAFNGKAGECVSFLVNNDKRNSAQVQYQNSSFELSPRSISILSDSQNVVFNTAEVSTPQNSRSVSSSQKLNSEQSWQEFKEVVPNFGDTSIRSNNLLEQMGTTKDASDYLWYTLSLEYDKTDDDGVILHVDSLAHVVHAFINNIYVGSAHGSHASNGLSFEQPISLNDGMNNISPLSVMVGLPDSGAYLERKVAGLRRVRIQGKEEKDFSTEHRWGYQVGLLGEKQQIYTNEGSNKVQWSNFGNSPQQPLTWYKTTFDVPLGDDPVALNLSSMGKGEAWVNGQSIGRYWPSFYTSMKRITIPEIKNHPWFLKNLPRELVEVERTNYGALNYHQPSQSIEEIMRIVQEARTPVEGSLVSWSSIVSTVDQNEFESNMEHEGDNNDHSTVV